MPVETAVFCNQLPSMAAVSLFVVGLAAVTAREIRYVETDLLPNWTPTYDMQVCARGAFTL